jgi:hypothetical protein
MESVHIKNRQQTIGCVFFGRISAPVKYTLGLELWAKVDLSLQKEET